MDTDSFFTAHERPAHDPHRITYFGVTDTRGKHSRFGIKQDDRSKHMYVIGKSGMGKSTLLENMAVQDIQAGEGLCFIDPHGETAEKLLQYVPEHRVKDVLYFAPFDLQYPISFNVLENVDADKRHLVVAGLMSAFEKIWVDAWSARMAYILQNTIGALLEYPGATLLGVNRMYIDKEYRKNVVAHVTDPSVRSFWVDEFTKYTDRYAQEATPAIQNKIGQFASNALIRNVIGQETSSFNIRELMDTRKIFIVNLSKGRVGEGNANLLGAMLITKIYLAAMSRADVPAHEKTKLPPFFLAVDEFQNFANKSFAEILSEARKYKLSLTIAHQYIEQMEEEVRAAVFGNVGTMITFRVGAYDADVLEKEFAPTFELDDLVNLGARQIYLKLMIDSVSSQPFSATTMPPIALPEVDQTDRAIAYSRAQYALPRAEVEQAIDAWSKRVYEDPEAEEKGRARAERRAQREQEEGRSSRERVAPAVSGGSSARGATERPSGKPPRPRNGGGAPRPPRPQSTGAQKEGAPQRDGVPVRRLPPKPKPTVRKEESRDELRSLLSNIATEGSRQQKSERSTHSEGSVPVGAQKTLSTVGGEVRAHDQTSRQQERGEVARDDGKSVTEEGRNELRGLLASLTRNASSPASSSKAPAPVDTQGASVSQTSANGSQKHRGSKPAASQSSGVHARPAHEEQKQTPVPRSAPEQSPKSDVDEDALRSMLHVDKPQI